MKGLVAYLRLARFENSVLPLFALGAGFTIVKSSDYLKLALTATTLVLLHSFVTIWNDIADEDSDKHNKISRIGDIRRSGVYRSLLYLMAYSLILILVAQFFLPIFTRVLILICLLLGWAYNDRPAQASRQPILSIAVLSLVYGSIPILLGISLGKISWAAIFLAIGWTIGRSSLSLLKDYKDASGDAKANKRTFLLFFGGTMTARLSFRLALLGYVICIVVVAGQLGAQFLKLLLLILVAGWLLYERSGLFRATKYKELNQIFLDCFKYQIIFDGLVILCLRT